MHPHRKLPVPLHRLVLAALCAGSASVPALAQQAAANVDAKTLAQYDKNHNGKLDPDELSAMQADQAKAAQVTSDSASGEDKDKVVALTPFEVNATEDKGYYGANTMSGTRLNSKIEDLAASITVVTKQQLNDTAAVDLNDIFLYESNTEGIGQFTDPTNDGRGIYDNVAGNPQTANRIRGLSAANIAIGGFAATSSIPIDTYNIDAVEISRGPNSNIFGLGDASGTVNLITASANTQRDTSNIQGRVDSYGGFRTSLDLNRPLIKDKLAVRFSAVYNETGFVRKPSIDRTDRQQIAFTYKPFKSTTISGSYESYHNFNSRANSETPRDTIAYWRAHGSPTWDPITFSPRVNGVLQAPITNDALLPAGLYSAGSSLARIVANVDNGVYASLMQGRNPTASVPIVAGTPNASANQRLIFTGTDIQRGGGGIFGGVATPLYNMPETTDKSIYDWTKYNTAAPNYARMRSDNFNLNVEQWFINTPTNGLALQLGWLRQDTYEYRRAFVAQQDGVPAVLQIDVNERGLDGKPNPYYLRPFIGGNEPQIYTKPTFNDNYRAQLAYQLDLTKQPNILKWLGKQRVSAYGEYREIISAPQNLRYRDQVTDNTDFISATAILTSNGGHLFPRYFLGGTGATGIQYANSGLVNPDGHYTATFVTPTTGVINSSDSVSINQVYFALGEQKRKIRTDGVSLQSFLVKDTIIPTLGVRQDRTYSEDNLTTPTLSNGLIDQTNLTNFGLNKKWNSGVTRTKGVVVKPFRAFESLTKRAQEGNFFAQTLRGLNVFYNQSDAFQPADTAYNVFGQVLPNPSGTTKEYGFGLSFLDDKLELRIRHYDTLQIHSRSTLGTIATRAVGMDFLGAGQTISFNLYAEAQSWMTTLHPTFTPQQINDAAAQYAGFTSDYIASVQGKTISDINDAESKGYEFELNYNPTRNWTLKIAGAEQKAFDSNLSAYLQQYIAQRLPVWMNVVDPVNNVLWWNESQGSQGIPSAYYVANVQAPLALAITNQGKAKPQTREYSMNLTTNYHLVGIAPEGSWLRNVSVGGSYRWASRAAIGYLAGAPDADGVVRTLDRNRIVYDKPMDNIDLLLTYNFRMFRDRIRARVQLNVRNVTENGHLQPIGVNPDGQIWRYRIVDPRQFIFSTSFDL